MLHKENVVAMGFEMNGIEFSPETLTTFPQHAALLGEIVTSFSLVEGAVGGIYGLLRHQDIEAAIQDLSNLSTNSKRVQAVRTELAKHPTLSQDSANDDLMKSILKYAEERNKVAHGVWGRHPNRSDIVYRLPVKKWINFVASIVDAGTAGKSIEKVTELASHIEEYSIAALKTLKSEGAMMLEGTLNLLNFLAREAAIADGWIEDGDKISTP